MANETIVLDLIPSMYKAGVEEENNNKCVNNSPEENRICPLCSSEVRLFFINFHEKLLMCANTECDFPFGYEELQYVKKEAASDDETITVQSRSVPSPSVTESTVSTSAWNEMERLSRADALEYQPVPSRRTSKHGKKKAEEQKILKTIKDIKILNEQLTEEDRPTDEDVQIKNPKWIKNLKNLEGISGFQLLKPEEISLLRKEEPDLGLGELKIDINPGNNICVSSINVERNINTGNDQQDNVTAGPTAEELKKTSNDNSPV